MPAGGAERNESQGDIKTTEGQRMPLPGKDGETVDWVGLYEEDIQRLSETSVIKNSVVYSSFFKIFIYEINISINSVLRHRQVKFI